MFLEKNAIFPYSKLEIGNIDEILFSSTCLYISGTYFIQWHNEEEPRPI